MHSDGSAQLELLLRRLGEHALELDAESLGGVAILTPRNQRAAHIDTPTRRLLVQLAREAGFANIALEV